MKTQTKIQKILFSFKNKSKKVDKNKKINFFKIQMSCSSENFVPDAVESVWVDDPSSFRPKSLPQSLCLASEPLICSDRDLFSPSSPQIYASSPPPLKRKRSSSPMPERTLEASLVTNHRCGDDHPPFFDWETSDFGACFNKVFAKEDGSMWITNDEYTSRVNYCPMCGKSAKKKMTKLKN